MNTTRMFGNLHSRWALALALGFYSQLGCAAEIVATLGATLKIDSPRTELQPRYFLENWAGSGDGTSRIVSDPDGSFPFAFKEDNQPFMTGKGVFDQDPGTGIIQVTYTFSACSDRKLNVLGAGLTLAEEDFAGGTWQTEKEKGLFPQMKGGELCVVAAQVKRLMLTSVQGRSITFLFDQPTPIMIQDDRQWGPNFSLRIGHNGEPRLFKKGEPWQLAFSMATGDRAKLIYDGPVKIQAGPEWIPFSADLDIDEGSALDFSALGFHDKPAGKYGYTLAKGPHFEFEKRPGVVQRFYGVNMCFSANFVEPEVAKRVAKRLARLGYNAIRIHHHDGGFVEGSSDQTTLNPQQIAKWDALIAACIEEGIYVTTDLYVSRPVMWKTVGIDRPGYIQMNEYKILVAVHEGAWENLKQFTRQWLTHVNPYTGRRYADEPALAWLAIVNEGNFGNFLDLMRNIPEWKQAWSRWLAEKKKSEPQAYKDIDDTLPESMWTPNRKHTAFTLFLKDMELKFVARAKAFLREELKCRALVTDMSCWTNHAVDQIPRSEFFDYVDDHFYVDHPQFLENEWQLPSSCANSNPLKGRNMGAQEVVFRRLMDKPFTITEYNFSAPGQFRGVGGIVTGALGALQDWSGIWRFAYSHQREAITGSQAPALNYFDMISDPLSQAAERASICLFLRGDLAPLTKSYTLALPKQALNTLRDTMPGNRTDWTWLGWYARLGTAVRDQVPAESTAGAVFPDVYAISSKQMEKQVEQQQPAWKMGDGALSIDRDAGTLTITTPRTCGGFAEQGTLTADALAFTLQRAPATVWVSALDAQPIRTSKRLLLTHLTNIQNTDIQYAQRALTVLTAWGHLPHLVRAGSAEITVALATPKAYRVYALAATGKRVQEVKTTVTATGLQFLAATDRMPGTATLMYEIVKE